MKRILFLTLTILSFAVNAEEKDPSLDDLKNRLQLRVESFVVSDDGSAIFSRGSTVSMMSGGAASEGIYIAQAKELNDAYLTFKYIIGQDRKVILNVTEYGRRDNSSKGRLPKFSDEVRRESFALKDFSPVTWVTKSMGDGRKMIVRFTPQISDEEARKLTYVPMAFSDAIITDNGGRMWGEGLGVTGEVAGVTSPYGTFYISYSEFPGSKTIGTARGSIIELSLTEKMNVKIRSNGPVLGAGYVAKVYGVFLPNKKGPLSHMANSIEGLLKLLK